jgi:hypothetical protein
MIYGGVNLDDAEYALEEFRENWSKEWTTSADYVIIKE